MNRPRKKLTHAQRRRYKMMFYRLIVVLVVAGTGCLLFFKSIPLVNQMFGTCKDFGPYGECLAHESAEPLLRYVMTSVAAILGTVLIGLVLQVVAWAYYWVVNRNQPCQGCGCPNHQRDDTEDGARAAASTALTVSLLTLFIASQ